MTTLQRERASAVCVHEGRLLCVQLRDPSTKIPRLFVPGGAIEPGETPLAAAERETLEETGYRVRGEPERVHVARYPFVWNGQPFQVTTHFISAQLVDPASAPALVNDAGYNEGVHWLPLGDVADAFAFDPAIQTAVLGFLHGD